jgi:hypothetical protein
MTFDLARRTTHVYHDDHDDHEDLLEDDDA